MASAQSTTFGNIVISALTAAAMTGTTLTLTGAITGTSATLSSNLTVSGAMSGATLSVLTGATLGDTDGAGCTSVQVLNGTVSGRSVTCP